MRVMLVLAAALAGLAVVPSALAKGPFQICGADACAQLAPETSPPVRIFGLQPSIPRTAPPAPAPYFVIRFADVGGALGYWIPSVSKLRLVSQSGIGGWVTPLPDETALLVEKTAGLVPYPPPTRYKAYVQLEPVKRPAGYLRLLTMGTPVASTPHVSDWLIVWFGAGTTPWTDYTSMLYVSKTGSFLKREDGTILRIPAGTAKKIRARQPLG